MPTISSACAAPLRLFLSLLLLFPLAFGGGLGCATDDADSNGSGQSDSGRTRDTGNEGGDDACENGLLDGDETDVDCGGSCGGCDFGEACRTEQDCGAGLCSAGYRCVTASCANGELDGDEEGTDCGGSCPVCLGGSCTGDGECATGYCNANICDRATCLDGVSNGNETGVDCGGDCPQCADGQICFDAVDCLNNYCRDNRCATATCSDGVQNQNETDLDCGGSCDPCAVDASCAVPGDCAQGLVCTGERCVQPAASCGDGSMNGDETDIDCGGSCPGCRNGDDCDDHPDCLSETCVFGVCESPTCFDGIQNQGEINIDCGAPCGACGDGASCTDDSHCASEICATGVCVSCDDNIQNGEETATDCGGPDCGGCALAQRCFEETDCLTGVCVVVPGASFGLCSQSCSTLADCSGFGSFRCSEATDLNDYCFPDDYQNGCSQDSSCFSGLCITRGGGMCTYGCDGLEDCPSGHACAGVPFGGSLITDPVYYQVCVPLGDSCLFETSCEGGICTNSGYCTAACLGSNQCPSGWECGAASGFCERL